VLDHDQDVGGGAVKQVYGEEIGGQDALGLGAEETGTGYRAAPGRRVGARAFENLSDGGGSHRHAKASEFAVDATIARAGFSFASRSTSVVMLRCVRGLPLYGSDLLAQRRRSRSRCQRRAGSGVTIRGIRMRRAFGMSLWSSAIIARSDQSGFGRLPVAVSWRRRMAS